MGPCAVTMTEMCVTTLDIWRCDGQYVNECFANSSLFHKALKEAFEAFCNKSVAGSTSAELMANFCDNLLKKVGCLLLMPSRPRIFLPALLSLSPLRQPTLHWAPL
jgi:hypothetical protein